MGKAYYLGEGVEKDLAQAEKYYQMAAKQGVEPAAIWLEKMKATYKH
jgi:TPR repeat protein